MGRGLGVRGIRVVQSKWGGGSRWVRRDWHGENELECRVIWELGRYASDLVREGFGRCKGE